MESSLEVDDYHKDTHDDNDNDTDTDPDIDNDNDNDNDIDSDIMATTTQTKMKPAWQTMPTAGNGGDVNDGYGNDISIMMAVTLTITMALALSTINGSDYVLNDDDDYLHSTQCQQHNMHLGWRWQLLYGDGT